MGNVADLSGKVTDLRLNHFKCIESGLDVSELMTELENSPHLWDVETGRQDTEGSPHRYTKSILLRWAKQKTLDACFNDLHADWEPEANELPAIFPLVNRVLEAVMPHDKTAKESLGRVMIAMLEPGGHIMLHSDEGAYADHYERFHVSLQSHVGNHFTSYVHQDCGEFVHMKPGELWFFNHRAPHTLDNFSALPRLHLIVDCVSPKYRMERSQ